MKPYTPGEVAQRREQQPVELPPTMVNTGGSNPPLSTNPTIVVTGSRYWTNYRRIEEMFTHLKPGLVIVGDCPTGADPLAKRAANALNIPCQLEQANWKLHGLAAGPIRNRKMLDSKPDMVVAFHEDIEKSKGTKDCYSEANRRGMSTMLITK